MPYKIIRNQQRTPDSTESLGGAALRTGLRTAARIGEAAVGLPGDIAQAALGAANYVSGGAVPTYGQVQEKLPISLPTSENVKQFQEKATGEYLKPQGENEQTWDDFVGLVTQLAIPISGPAGLAKAGATTKALQAVPKAAKVAGIGTLGARAVKELGGSPITQEGTKLGLMLATGLRGGRQALEQQQKAAYDIVKNIPPSVTHEIPALETHLKKLTKYIDSGIRTPDKKALADILESVEKAIDKGTQRIFKDGKYTRTAAIPIGEAVEIEKGINQLNRDYTYPRQAKPYLADLKKEVQNVIDEYGKTNKPWYNAYTESKDITRGLKDRSKVNQFLQENVDFKKNLKSVLTSKLLYGGLYFAPQKVATGLALSPIAYATREIQELGELLYKSKHAQKYYKDAMKSALEGNKTAFAHSAARLDKVVQKYEQENIPKGSFRIIRNR